MQTADTMTANTILFNAIGGLCDQLTRYDQSPVDPGNCFPPQAMPMEEALAAAKEEADSNLALPHLLLVLVKETLPSVIGGNIPEADVCCKIISALMMNSQPPISQTVAGILFAGGIVATPHVQCRSLFLMTAIVCCMYPAGFVVSW